MRRLPTVVVVAIAATVLAVGCGDGDDEPPTAAETITAGKETYQEICAACHGSNLRGTAAGPPFLHEVYEPGHHPDAAFYRAVQQGVQPHHWDFGPMPPVLTLDEEEIAQVIAYVRSEQRKAGIG